MSHFSRAFPYLLIALCLGPTNRMFGATHTVTTTGDTGAGSLRQTVATSTTNDTIDFSVTGTITLTSGEIALDKNLIVSGPGADVLAVSGNNASRIFNVASNATVSVSGLTFKNGTDASGAGGGIHNAGTLTLLACTISNCQAGAAGTPLSGGGAIFNATSGVLVVVNSTLDHNQATGGAGDESGGGIYNAGGSATISNSTVAANVAQGTNGFGGGVFNLSGSNVLISSTVALNSAAGAGGGVANSNGVFTVTDSIIATNAATSVTTNAPDAIGDFVSGGFNLIGDADDSTGFGGDLIGSAASPLDPLFGPLQNNGGTTFTLELLPGSPAINAGSCASTNGTDADQRGFPRPVGPACDIGPFEVQACTNLGSTITCISTNLVGVPIDPAGGRVFFDTPTFTSSCPGANVQTTPPSGGLFPIGTNAIPAVLLDASGTELTNCSFTVIIRGIDEELNDAIAVAQGLGLSLKLQNVIVRKLNAAKKTLLAGHRGQTCRTLQKLVTRVNAEVRHGFITTDQANQLFVPISGVEGAVGCR